MPICMFIDVQGVSKITVTKLVVHDRVSEELFLDFSVIIPSFYTSPDKCTTVMFKDL